MTLVAYGGKAAGGFFLKQICSVLRTLSIGRRAPALGGVFGSTRWPTVVGRRGLVCQLARSDLSSQTSCSVNVRPKQQINKILNFTIS